MKFLKEFCLVLCVFGISALPTDETSVELKMRAGKMLNDWLESGKEGNPEEQGPYFEGDIILPKEARGGVKRPAAKWKGGRIPFKIDESFSASEREILHKAMKEISDNSCIKFEPMRDERDCIVFQKENSGCWSHVGRIGGCQKVNLHTYCLRTLGTPMHEIMHALGLYHTQNRHDRDKYVAIKFENIDKDKHPNFVQLSTDEIETYDIEYDFGSVLHYSSRAFSNNGKITIEPRDGKQETRDLMGQRVKLSENDIKKLNKMYCS